WLARRAEVQHCVTFRFMSRWCRAVVWMKDDPFGVEFAEIQVASKRLRAEGIAIGTSPLHYRLDYVVETTDESVTSRLSVTSRAKDGGVPLTFGVTQRGSDMPMPTRTVRSSCSQRRGLSRLRGRGRLRSRSLAGDQSGADSPSRSAHRRRACRDGCGLGVRARSWRAAGRPALLVPPLGVPITTCSATRRSTAPSPRTSRSTATGSWWTIPASPGGLRRPLGFTRLTRTGSTPSGRALAHPGKAGAQLCGGQALRVRPSSHLVPAPALGEPAGV